MAGEVVLLAPRATKVFYDLDTPVTLGRLERGETVAYVGPRGFQDFDMVLSYTGGPALELLRAVTGAKRAVPLYGHVDPDTYAPTAGEEAFRGDLSYIGTYAVDRQQTLDALFLEPARRSPERRFVLAGAQYPADFAWSSNVYFVRHLAPPQHPAFYGSSRLTLNVTRRDMAAMGWCPSGRLFEAASCAACMISDAWAGLEQFFSPGEELIIANSPGDTLAALEQSDTELRRIGENARARVLAEHTSDRRAAQLETILADARESDANANAMLEA
jgi:spore maturation protein CgeB